MLRAAVPAVSATLSACQRVSARTIDADRSARSRCGRHRQKEPPVSIPVSMQLSLTAITVNEDRTDRDPTHSALMHKELGDCTQPIAKRLRSSYATSGTVELASTPVFKKAPAHTHVVPVGLTPQSWNDDLRLCELAQQLYGMSDDEFEHTKLTSPELFLQSLRMAKRHQEHEEHAAQMRLRSAPAKLATSATQTAPNDVLSMRNSFKSFTAGMSLHHVESMMLAMTQPLSQCARKL